MSGKLRDKVLDLGIDTIERHIFLCADASKLKSFSCGTARMYPTFASCSA